MQFLYILVNLGKMMFDQHVIGLKLSKLLLKFAYTKKFITAFLFIFMQQEAITKKLLIKLQFMQKVESNKYQKKINIILIQQNKAMLKNVKV